MMTMMLMEANILIMIIINNVYDVIDVIDDDDDDYDYDFFPHKLIVRDTPLNCSNVSIHNTSM